MERLSPDDPSRIGPYRLLSRLGAGGMGRVYLARADDDGPEAATVALKLIRPEAAEQDEFRRRFAREVAAARRVSGAWTARVLDADTGADMPWVATEYVPGPTLRAVVRGDFGPLPSASAHVLAHRLGQALHAIHGADLVHRDLKPSNILLTVDGPRVIDFGIAHAVDASLDGSTITPAGTLIGTPEFMSPEQVRGDRVTSAADVFSLGGALAYAATGRSPFRGEGTAVHALMFRIAYEEPELTGVPEALAELVRHCLAKDPAERPTVPEILERTRRAPAGAWLPAELLARLDRVAARPLPRVPRRGDPATPFREPEFPDFPDSPGGAGRRDPLDAPEAGITPPVIRRTPPTRRALVRQRLMGTLAAVVGVLSVALGVWVAAPAVGLLFEDGSDEKGTGGATDGGTLFDRPGEWQARLGSYRGQSPFVLHLSFTGANNAEYTAATTDAVCAGHFVDSGRNATEIWLGHPTTRVILPEGAPTSRCPRLGRIHLEDEEGEMSWRYAKDTGTPVVLAARNGSPIPARFLGTRHSGDWTVTVHRGKVGAVAVTGTADLSGRHCAWSAVVMNADKTLLAAPAHLDASASDPGCKAPEGLLTYTAK